jgi:hypothetical protein
MTNKRLALSGVLCFFFAVESFSQHRHWHDSRKDSLNEITNPYDRPESCVWRRLGVGLGLSNLGACVPGFALTDIATQGPGSTSGSSSDQSFTMSIGILFRLDQNYSLHISAGSSRCESEQTIDSRNTQPPATNYTITSWSSWQNVSYFSGGITRTLYQKGRSGIHCGLDALLLLRRNWHEQIASTAYTHDTYNDLQTGFIMTDMRGRDGTSFGLNAFIGAEYRILKGIFLAIDLSNPFLQTTVNGNISQEIFPSGTPPPAMSSPVINSAVYYNGFGFANPCVLGSVTYKF